MYRAILTIDDISSENTPAMVDFLTEQHIPALLFAVGENVEAHYPEALYAVKAGFTVGNHSFTHPRFSGLRYEDAIREIEATEAVLDRLYRDAGVLRRFRPFRFPYGDSGGENDARLQAYLRRSGFHALRDTRICYPWWREAGRHERADTAWTFDFGEYRIRPGSGFTEADVLARMEGTDPSSGAPLLSAESGNILLLHAHDETEAILPRYWQRFLTHAVQLGVVFDPPEFR